MKKLRFFPFLLPVINILISLAAMGASGSSNGFGPFLLFNVLLLAIAGLVYVRQHSGAENAAQRGEKLLEDLALTAFDAPAEVQQKFESSLVGAASVLGPGGALSPAQGTTVVGRVRGIATKIATGTSTIARQQFELFHTYSYVTVDPGEAACRFHFVGRDSAAKWSELLGTLKEHKLEDEAFDAQWVVAGDPEIAKATLDSKLRAQLLELQARARKVSTVGMSIELTGDGLVVRWPGELDRELALTLRDLALALRERLLATLEQQGLLASSSEVRAVASASPSEEREAALAVSPALTANSGKN